MEVYVIGSGTGVPSLRRGSPGTVVKVKSSTLLIDSGSGTLRRLLEVGISILEVNYLLYSHFHPDHTADLVPFLFASNYGSEEKRKDSVHLLGPVGMEKFYKNLQQVYGRWITPQGYSLSIREITDDAVAFEDFTLKGSPLVHSDYSIGFRLRDTGGKEIAYSGDTDYCPGLIELAKGVDLLILECSFPDERKVEGHLTPSLAGRVAREAQCAQLLLTHLYPPCDDCDIKSAVAKHYAGEITIAEDLMKIVV
jgi:ribonuclease BN (tRNA processing enzyme)